MEVDVVEEQIIEVKVADVTDLEKQEFVNTVKALVTHDVPPDLYIPPHALHVILEIFEGPLDFLLYLIKRHNLDILDIQVSKITDQYISYINLMEKLEVELAADYLEMAAMLAEIKSRMLLPKQNVEGEAEEEDPRAELIRKLQEYEQIKKVAAELDLLPQQGRDFFYCYAEPVIPKMVKPQPELTIDDLLLAFKDILLRADLQTSHNIEREALTVREKMSYILGCLNKDIFSNLAEFFNYTEGKLGIVVTLLAVLEMAREWIIEITQAQPFAPIYIRLKTHGTE